METIRSILLNDKDKKEILSIDLSKSHMSKNFTLTKEEILSTKSMIKPYIKVGYSLQLLFIKNLGRPIPIDYKEIPIEILEFIGEQLNITNVNIEKYFTTEITRKRNSQHLVEILGYSKFIITDEITNIAKILSMNISSKKQLVLEFLDRLKELKIIAPALATVEEFLYQIMQDTNSNIYKNIVFQIPDKAKLDTLLTPDDKGISPFSHIKNIEINSTAKGLKTLLKHIKFINDFNCPCNLDFLSPEKLRFFSDEINKSNRFRIQRFSDENKRYSYLAMFLLFRKKTFVDMVIEINSNFTHKVMRNSKKKTEKHNESNYKNYKSNSETLKDIITQIIEIDNFEKFKKYKESLLKLKEELDSQGDILDDIDSLVESKYSFNYTNEMIELIEFDSNTKPEFVEFIKSFKEYKYKKKIDVDISIFSKQWQKDIKKYDLNKKVVELAMIYSIRDGIRSGDIFVKESVKYNSYDHYLLETIEPTAPDEATSFLNKIKEAFKRPTAFEFSSDFEKEEKNKIAEKVYAFFPRISMIDMIYEVHSWNGFLDDFKENIDSSGPNRQKNIVATLLANGHNIGFSRMANSGSIDESVLRRTNEYYFNNNTLSKAQITLVNYHHNLDISKNWGTGTKSSSDGMRIQITSKTIYADYNGHYRNRGGAIYRHVSDQYSPYFVSMLRGRDSNYVLDGLLYHYTKLEISEHSTDTAGYTEQMFALTYLLGFTFKPRIKNADKQQLYYFENLEVGNIKFKKINEKLIIDNYYEIMRLIKSIEAKTVKASVILDKINSYARDNSVAKGLKELGRLLKTMYLLDFFTDSNLRKEVQQMLNKGESINSVSRLIHFGKSGRVNETTIDEQLEKASSLNILLGVLVTWNSRYLEKVQKKIKDEEWYDEESFKRISPLGTRHVNFLGKYVFNEDKVKTEDGLRDLYLKK